jgi:hypothetical protein
LTQENDSDDRILSAGEAFRFDRTGIALVNALGSDAALAFSSGLDAEHARPSAPRSVPVSLGAEIARLCTRIDRHRLAQLPPATRNAMVECEARRMRAQVLWLVLQRTRHAAVQSVAIAAAFGRRTFLQVRRLAARRGRVETQQGI